MAESEVTRSMVLMFRIAELNALLKFAGKSTAGKKTDLQKRALDLVKANPTNDVRMKVRELSKAMYRTIANATSVNPYAKTFVGNNANNEPPPLRIRYSVGYLYYRVSQSQNVPFTGCSSVTDISY